MIAQLGNRRGAAHNRDRPSAATHSPRSRKTVGGTSGESEHPEIFDLQMVGELFDNRRPVEQLPIGLKRRSANSRPVWRNDAHAQLASGCFS